MISKVFLLRQSLKAQSLHIPQLLGALNSKGLKVHVKRFFVIGFSHSIMCSGARMGQSLHYFSHHTFSLLICQNIWLQLRSTGGDCHVLLCCCWLCPMSWARGYSSKAAPAVLHSEQRGSRGGGRAEGSVLMQSSSALLWSEVIVFVHSESPWLKCQPLLHNCLIRFLPTAESYSPRIPFPGRSSNTHPTHLNSSLHE